MKYLVSLILFFAVSTIYAQKNIVESLQTRRAGEGTVTVHQDAHITSLLGTRYVSSGSSSSKTIKARGYRVQVYAGNNSRVARSEAIAIANKVKATFPEAAVYTYFQSPRWLCRVGDYRTVEEAHEAMRKLKESGQFKEISIVREQINIPIE
ncbi:SPOR domain-containing protein [uncultured Bacteroides sp.]|uniref:SPOR domain-containing protein n=1 Tax=uncultured Bacteroides sp. TaxID=162156 RepID=UPI0026184C2B|nr:SPOR domain-containing protein [uncultured Bacteroides sp.]